MPSSNTRHDSGLHSGDFFFLFLYDPCEDRFAYLDVSTNFIIETIQQAVIGTEQICSAKSENDFSFIHFIPNKYIVCLSFPFCLSILNGLFVPRTYYLWRCHQIISNSCFSINVLICFLRWIKYQIAYSFPQHFVMLNSKLFSRAYSKVLRKME